MDSQMLLLSTDLSERIGDIIHESLGITVRGLRFALNSEGNMTGQQYREQVKFFLLGVFVVVGVLSLMGAKLLDQEDVVLLNSDRYRIAAWGDGMAHGAFVMDSITGEAKIVYRLKDVEEDRILERNHLNMRFTEIPE